eukprot:TRINITY_DN14497_c0_g1_i1.p1 TRINITY_DN14497_c0_g1~~TRINITY_DN14497_c0_g1_i1.p1  ORF type:complete len:472 (+),score=112.89 TRINITY_DN14497_c0_g1_i1:112-1527(+)
MCIRDSPHTDHQRPPEDVCAKWRLGLALAGAYSLNYFWRYPIFMLPSEELHVHVVTLFGKTLDLQACFSMAFTLGFGAAKIPAVSAMSSQYFFSHRLRCCLGLFIFTMLTMGVGVYAFQDIPGLQVAAVFVSSFFSSWIYGGLVTYIEGRESTELLLAVLAGFFVYAGNLSRGTASVVLGWGVTPLLMPLVVGLVTCPIACFLMVLVGRMPGPSVADVSSRSKRRAMTSAQRKEFCGQWWLGILFMLFAYTSVATMRSFRDFYVQQIFAAAMDRTKDQVPSYTYFIADAPGAVLSCAALGAANKISDHIVALKALFAAQIAAVALGLFSTLLFHVGAIGGLAWQMLLGVGVYVSYSLMQTPVFERLFAATGTEGTCSFLIFLSDFCAYVGTTCLLLYNSFGPMDTDGDNDNDAVLNLYLGVLWGAGVAVLVCLSVCLVYFVRKLETRKLARCYDKKEDIEELETPFGIANM